jgi:ADP-heptose:LPS heptosyltransferase
MRSLSRTVSRRIEHVRKIAVLRANGLGDLVFALPALEALRAAYPDAEVVLLGREWQAALLGARPSPVDRCVAVPVARGVWEDPGSEEDPAEVADFVGRMREERFDLALQLHGGGRHSNPLMAAFGARVSAGSCTPDAPRLDRWVPYVYLQPEVLRYLELVGLVGAPAVGLEPRLAVTDADRAAAEEVLPASAGPLALLHPGASDVRRRWPAERFAAVGDALAARGACVLVNGGPAERGLVAEVVAAMAADALPVELGLDRLLGVLAACDVVVANDTGPLHVAAAVGAPTAGLFWGPNVVNSPPPGRARHRPLAALDLACPVCGADGLREGCGHDASRLGSIPADEVAAAAQDLLGLEPDDPGALARALDVRAAAEGGVPRRRRRAPVAAA